MAFRLHALVLQEGSAAGIPAGVSAIPFREIVALVAEVSYVRITPDADDAATAREWIDALAARRAVLPAPYGTVFRSRDALARWLELHYVSLTDALEHVGDRVASRVHVRAGDAGDAELGAAADAIFRALRRHAVSSVTLGALDAGAESAAFLVERDLWGAFEDGVREEARRFPSHEVTLTGPWAPFDFVRLQFST